MRADHGTCYTDGQEWVALREATERWREMPRKQKFGKAPYTSWCYDCKAWHLNEPAIDGGQQ